MKTVFGLVLVNVGVLFAAVPAYADADLPLTPAFAEAVSAYRDCVLGSLDRAASARPAQMAAAAMAACGAAHDAVRTQLSADVGAAHPRTSHQAAKERAEAGMARIDPMIAAIAIDQARTRTGAAAATPAPSLARQGTIG